MSRPAVMPTGEALHVLDLSGVFYCRSELSAPFGLDLPPFEGTLMFHLVAKGACWLEVPGREALRIGPGDLALVPHGGGHRLVSEPGRLARGLFELERELLSARYEVLRHGGGGDETILLCGAVRAEHPSAQRLVGLLPEVVHVDAWEAHEAEWLQSTLRFISAEARAMRVGGETILTRLCDIVVIQAIRAWLAAVPAGEGGWLAALRDEHLGRALALIHREPERRFTLEELAEVALLSRSAFSQRFTDMVGESAVQYATRYRMEVAARWIGDGELSVAEIAARLDYASEAAFRRAFRRVMGITPGALRRRSTAHVEGGPSAG